MVSLCVFNLFIKSYDQKIFKDEISSKLSQQKQVFLSILTINGKALFNKFSHC